ncbi:DUF4065 domain-containing protein [Acetobacteraceae bacterium EV16G]|uniref:DUF4065 domain-containing protein n=1 Tax=Sorlinia euscelidii TaxID=3081148 RepID=A0ABU7TZH2_9PROT
MPMKPLTAARLVCERSGWTITNLKLQKILYLAHMFYTGKHDGQALIDGSFEAWDYGPVSPDVYKAIAHFGRDPIQNVFADHDSVDEYARTYLNLFNDQLMKFSAAELVGITHWKGGAWYKNYTPGEKNVLIPPEDIRTEYEARVAQSKKGKGPSDTPRARLI